MLIEVEQLTKHFRVQRGLFRAHQVRAVHNVSFQIDRGETVGLVGESGCGKSTVGRCLLRLINPDNGQIRFDGTDMVRLRQAELRPLRRRLQMVFQNPLGSMNPAYTVEATLLDAMRQLPDQSAARRRERINMLLEQVGLDRRFLQRTPKEMSGGQLQRVSIARALAPNPDFVFLDEPTSALDLSVRGQIINLLADLQEQRHLAYLFVSHDLGVVKFLAHRVLVMYLGEVVEAGPTRSLFTTPGHPYTQALLAAAHVRQTAEPPAALIRGEVARPEAHPLGCIFAHRCPYVYHRCRTEAPPPIRVAPDHIVRCWLVTDTADSPHQEGGKGSCANP